MLRRCRRRAHEPTRADRRDGGARRGVAERRARPARRRAHRRGAHGERPERARAALSRRLPAPPRGARMDQRPHRTDRNALVGGNGRGHASGRGGADRARARRHHGVQQSGARADQADGGQHPDRVHRRGRSDRRRLRGQPGATRRQRHGVRGHGWSDRRQMARGAEGDGAAPHARADGHAPGDTDPPGVLALGASRRAAPRPGGGGRRRARRRGDRARDHIFRRRRRPRPGDRAACADLGQRAAHHMRSPCVIACRRTTPRPPR